jgi:hypothetical protein
MPFTPEEIQHLVSIGKLQEKHVAMLPKELQGTALDAVLKRKLQQMPMIASAPLKTATDVATTGLGMAGKAWNALGPTAVQLGLSATGHPWLGMAAGHALSRTGFKGSAPAPAKPSSSPPAKMTGTGADVPTGMAPMGGFSMGSTGSWSGPKATPPPSAPKLPNFAPEPFPAGRAQAPALPRFGGEPAPPPPPMPGNVERVDPRPSAYSGLRNPGATPEIAEQVQRGVQNDFRGRVSIRKPSGRSEFPAGADKRTPPDVFKQLLDEQAELSGDPREVEAIRAFLAQALGKR